MDMPGGLSTSLAPDHFKELVKDLMPDAVYIDKIYLPSEGGPVPRTDYFSTKLDRRLKPDPPPPAGTLSRPRPPQATDGTGSEQEPQVGQATDNLRALVRYPCLAFDRETPDGQVRWCYPKFLSPTGGFGIPPTLVEEYHIATETFFQSPIKTEFSKVT